MNLDDRSSSLMSAFMFPLVALVLSIFFSPLPITSLCTNWDVSIVYLFKPELVPLVSARAIVDALLLPAL